MTDSEIGEPRPVEGRTPRSVPAMQALRVTGMLLVVLLHASLAHLTNPFHCLRPLVDPSTGVEFDHLFRWILGFVMPLFFLLAGIRAAHVYERQRRGAFLKERVKRLLVPFCLGVVTVVPVTGLIWCGALLASGRTFKDLKGQWVGPMHLWFVEYLFLQCLAFWAARALANTLAGRFPRAFLPLSGLKPVLLSPWKPLLFAVPTGLILFADVEAVFRLKNSFAPNPLRLLHYGIFFAAGAWLSQVRNLKNQFVPFSSLYLTLSVPVFVCLTGLLSRHLEGPLDGSTWFLLRASAALFPWLMLFGLSGLFFRLFERRSRVLAFLSEASYWVYLSHFGILILLQILLFPSPWPALVKLLVAVAGTLAVALLSYQLFVRNTVVGVLLTGLWVVRCPRNDHGATRETADSIRAGDALAVG